jgi:hypothetical protein
VIFILLPFKLLNLLTPICAQVSDHALQWSVEWTPVSALFVQQSTARQIRLVVRSTQSLGPFTPPNPMAGLGGMMAMMGGMMNPAIAQMQAQQIVLGQQMAMDPAMQQLAAQQMQMQMQMGGMGMPGMNSAMGRAVMPMSMTTDSYGTQPGQYSAGGGYW